MYHWNSAESVSSMSAWRDAFVGLHGASRMAVADAAPWTGRLEWQRSKTYGIALCGGIQEDLSRETRHIRSDPRGAYELLVPVAGAALVEQGPSSGEITPGFLALCDTDRPMAFAHKDDFVSIALIVPGQEVDRRSPATARKPQVFSGASGLGRVIRQMVTTLQEEREQLSETTFDIACEHLLDLVCLAAEGATDSAPAEQRATVEAEIRRHVRRHACDPDLNVAGIARALGWSTRYIQEVLKAAGTTSRDLIRRERLHLARTRLASANWAGHSIAQITYSCGFGSHASFSTAFRQEFGMTPRDARKSVLPFSVDRD
ncbi:helix-turn-helix domain-containing protein [Streptomyces sp. NPDC002523]